MKRMCLVVLFALACSGGSRGTPAPDTQAVLSCAGLSEADCAHASNCHAVFTSEELCDSLCCPSHFAGCAAGPANCDEHRSGVCSGACAMGNSVCMGSLVQGYTEDGCCPEGCVAISQCAGVTEAHLRGVRRGERIRCTLRLVTRPPATPATSLSSARKAAHSNDAISG
jgi:hypothetical protein